MGSMISLSVGQINIDYGKNEFFQNHAHLFQEGDRGVNEYDYVNDDDTRPRPATLALSSAAA